MKYLSVRCWPSVLVVVMLPLLGNCSGQSGDVCTYGEDQTCNNDPTISAKHGTCGMDGKCTCKDGFVLIPTTGKCD